MGDKPMFFFPAVYDGHVRSRRHVTKRITADFDEAEQDALAATEQV
jgi:hypothetical protein